jgi:hypothetical protein
MKRIIFVRDHSQECNEAEQLLRKYKVDFVTFVENSDDGIPCLIVPDSSCSYTGYSEISEYANSIFSEYQQS